MKKTMIILSAVFLIIIFSFCIFYFYSISIDQKALLIELSKSYPTYLDQSSEVREGSDDNKIGFKVESQENLLIKEEKIGTSTIRECDGGFCMVKNDGEEILIINKDSSYFPVARWRDWFFYGDGIYADKVKVYAVNFDSGERKEIFDSEIYSKIERGNIGITQLVVLDNNLYITIGGYLVRGEMFFIDLTNFSEPELVVDNDVYLEKRGEFIVGVTGDGDAGYVMEKYYSFDQKNKIFKEIFKVSTDMGVGEKVVYYDDDKFIVARTKSVDDIFDSPIYNDSYYSINVSDLSKQELGSDYKYPIIPRKRLGYYMGDYIFLEKVRWRKNWNVYEFSEKNLSFEYPLEWKVVEDEYYRNELKISGKLDNGDVMVVNLMFYDGVKDYQKWLENNREIGLHTPSQYHWWVRGDSNWSLYTVINEQKGVNQLNAYLRSNDEIIVVYGDEKSMSSDIIGAMLESFEVF